MYLFLKKDILHEIFPQYTFAKILRQLYFFKEWYLLIALMEAV